MRAQYPEQMVLSDPEESDWRYICATWLRSYRESESCEAIVDDAYYPWQRARIARIRDREPLVIVARDKDNPVYVYGYGVFERIGRAFVAHWVYVRKGEKRQGIARLLLATALERIGRGSSQLVMTHRTYFEPKCRDLGFAFEKLERLYAPAKEEAHAAQ